MPLWVYTEYWNEACDGGNSLFDSMPKILIDF